MKSLARLIAMTCVAALALQLYFLGRIALMRIVPPSSTTFQRSEIWRLVSTRGQLPWAEQWTDHGGIANGLRRAVIASEDAGFTHHSGVEWEAIESAWTRNQKAEARLEARMQARLARSTRPGRTAAAPPPVAKVVGGSTITQQLAKNLFLAGERTLPRKAQEFVLTMMLEAVLGKDRILDIYLNEVEWGEGVFGAEAASRHYFHVPASRLSSWQAARLAVMLPAPKRFEKQPGSAYLTGRAGAIARRMEDVALP